MVRKCDIGTRASIMAGHLAQRKHFHCTVIVEHASGNGLLCTTTLLCEIVWIDETVRSMSTLIGAFESTNWCSSFW